MTQFKQTLKAHLIAALGLAPGELSDDTELFSSGLLDSLRVLDLVSFVEQESGARLSPSAVTLEHFDSIERISSFIARLANDRQAS